MGVFSGNVGHLTYNQLRAPDFLSVYAGSVSEHSHFAFSCVITVSWGGIDNYEIEFLRVKGKKINEPREKNDPTCYSSMLVLFVSYESY